MRRTILLLAGVLLSVVALGSDSPKEYDDKTDVVGIEGTWRLIDGEFNGEKIKPSTQLLMTICKGNYTIAELGGSTERGNYRIDTTRKPPHLDRSPSINSGAEKFIYQIDGSTLKTAGIATADEVRRPQGFNDKGVVVLIYKRVK
jgi:uncharacterized protein (TIGR03067 family)